MSANAILLLQAILIFLQMINASVTPQAGFPPAVTPLIGAAIGSLQFYLQHVGNQKIPEGAQSTGK